MVNEKLKRVEEALGLVEALAYEIIESGHELPVNFVGEFGRAFDQIVDLVHDLAYMIPEQDAE